MTQEETRLKEIEEQIESLKKERTVLKEKISSVNDDANFTRMLSRVEMKVAFGNVLFIYCSDDDGLEHYDSYQNHTDGIYKFMSKLIDKIVKKLGNPKYYDLKDARDSRYCPVPHFRVLIFNTPDGWNDTLEDVINKIKIEKDDTR